MSKSVPAAALLFRRLSRICSSSVESFLGGSSLVSIPVLSFLATGCGGEVTSVPTFEIRDSSGVTIVENRGAVEAGTGGWGLSQDPLIEIGSFGGSEESQLFRVRGARRLPDGRVAVANDGTLELRFFGSDGSHLFNVGGEGEGPGEFSSIRLLGLLGDSLVVLDRRLKRVSILHPDQGFVRSFPLEDGVAAYAMNGWIFDGGTVLIEDLPLSDSGAFEEGFNRTPVPYRSSDMSGKLSTDFGSLPGPEMVTLTRQTEHGLATMMNSVPFGKSPTLTVAGDHLFFGAQDEYEVKVFGEDGSLLRVIRLDRPPLPVTDEELNAFMEEELDGIGDEEEARAWRRELETMPRPDYFPPHGSIYADALGTLFVEDFRLPGRSTVGVSVFDSEGILTGCFELPAGLEVLDVGEDYLLALYQDDLEVEYLRLYTLVRPEGGP